jgi:8-oxo-dGTP pyrophosphatase MutT (NUDIX family)
MRPAIRQLSSRIVYKNRWITVREDEIERLDGSRGIYGVVDKPDFALVIPEESGGFHLVEQYRYPVQARMWEFPQGTLPDGHDGSPEYRAQLELAEETGLSARTLTHLGHLHCAHGITGQAFDVFHATELTQGESKREIEEQDMRQAWFSRADFEAMITNGIITDDSTIAAYTLLQLAERSTRARTTLP